MTGHPPARTGAVRLEPEAPVERSLLGGSADVVAPQLLHKVLVHGSRRVRIVEVEAYGGADDPASHAYKGPTARNATMFASPGSLYVYFVYGMHWCANVVCGPTGVAEAVLVRGAEPIDGLVEMRSARPAARRDVDLCNGPAKLCSALGLDGRHDGVDLCDGAGQVRLVDDGVPPPPHVGVSGRVGVAAAPERPWRFFVPDDPNVSRSR